MPTPRRPVELSPPSRQTLRRYGLDEEAWRTLVKRQGGLCPVCDQLLAGRKIVIDHAHVRGFRKMRPENKRRHVRGVLHSFCNRYVRGWLTLARARAILAYLESHHERSSGSAP